MQGFFPFDKFRVRMTACLVEINLHLLMEDEYELKP
jgi:hypothetical protein